MFDSGLGGLTAVKELIRELPGEGIVYFGDTGRVPYGTKSVDTIIKFVHSDIRFLMEFDIKLILVACGTASSIALPVVADSYPIPIMGVVEPTVEGALRATKNGRVGIIGTQGTIASGSYERLIQERDAHIHTVSRACPLFVPLAENGCTIGEVARLVTEEYLAPIKAEGVDTLILGCTHYPLLRQTIQAYMGPEVALIDSGGQAAQAAERMLARRGMLADAPPEKQYQFYVSDSVESFSQLASVFLEREIDGAVEKIDIEKYST